MINNEQEIWEKLLSTKRYNEIDNNNVTTGNTNYNDPRCEFQRDYDRIVFSFPFRRLQDKTQVIPFPESDFVHSRLTHSLETASVGRSLGLIIGKFLKEECNLVVNEYEIGALVATVCLAHDIGNPPFGHKGEQFISDYFIEDKANTNIFNFIEKEELNDLTSFDGNPNGFKMIANKELNLTCATLGVYSKYTCSSSSKRDKKRKSQKKYGFFVEQKEDFKKIANELGLLKDTDQEYVWRRHPLTFLAEAADDICNAIIDFEDACTIGLIHFKKRNSINDEEEIESGRDILESFVPEEKLEDYKNMKFRNIKERISYLRAKAIGKLICLVVEKFKENYYGIMNGEFDKALFGLIKDNSIEKIEKLRKAKVFNNRTVLETEIAGAEILHGLLKAFVEASIGTCDKCEDKGTTKNIHLKMLLPKECRPNDDESDYTKILKIIDYISGMTDSYALKLFRKIKGISL